MSYSNCALHKLWEQKIIRRKLSRRHNTNRRNNMAGKSTSTVWEFKSMRTTTSKACTSKAYFLKTTNVFGQVNVFHEALNSNKFERVSSSLKFVRISYANISYQWISAWNLIRTSTYSPTKQSGPFHYPILFQIRQKRFSLISFFPAI